MTIAQLLQWQYAGYAKFHQSRANLLIHIVVVPFFLFGNVLLVVSMANFAWGVSAIALATMILSMALQGRGHGQESYPPEPFTGPINVIARILLEQWITFPRFVLSGGWSHAWRSSVRQSA